MQISKLLIFSLITFGGVLAQAALPECPTTIKKFDFEAKIIDPTKSTSSLIKYKVGDYYVVCGEGYTITNPAVIQNGRNLPLVIRNVSFAPSAGVSPALTIKSGKDVILDGTTITAPNALKITGANHQLINVKLTGTRAASSTGVQLALAKDLIAENLTITNFANGIVADTQSTATFTKPVVTWTYEPGAAQMQGDIGMLLGDDATTAFGTATGTMGAMLGSAPEAPADAAERESAAKVILDQPTVKGFVDGIKVFAGKQLEIRGGEVQGYPESSSALFAATQAWPGETGILLNGNDHQLLTAPGLDAGQPTDIGTVVLGFAAQLSLEGSNIKLDRPKLWINDMSAAQVNRCWERGSGVTDCAAKGIEGIAISDVTDITTVQYRSEINSGKTSYNFVYYPELDRDEATALQNPIVLGKYCSKRRDVEIDGVVTQVCDMAQSGNAIEQVVGVLPDAVCKGEAGRFSLVETNRYSEHQYEFSKSKAIECVVGREFHHVDKNSNEKSIALLVNVDGAYQTRELDPNTCHVSCDLTANGVAELQADANRYISVLQTLSTGDVIGHKQWPTASDVNREGSYTPVQVSIIPDVKPTTPGMQTASIDMAGVSNSGGGNNLPSGGSSALDLPDSTTGSGDDAADDAASGNNFTGDFGGNGVISTDNGGSGSLLSGGASLGMKSGCSLIIE